MSRNTTNHVNGTSSESRMSIGKPWSPRTRLIVSVFLLWHVSALFVAPAAVPPTSDLMLTIWGWYRPYLEVLYLNHGYHFFAPEPGPSHLIRYELEFADGRKEQGFFPDKNRHWPRLRYHRHFMLSEHLSQYAEDGAPPGTLAAFSRSYGHHLLHTSKAVSARMILVRHLYPSPSQVLEGMTLTDRKLYFERPLGTFLADGSEVLPKAIEPSSDTIPKPVPEQIPTSEVSLEVAEELPWTGRELRR